MIVSVIGCGSVGLRHVENLLALGVSDREIVVVDVDSEAVKRVSDRVRFITVGNTMSDGLVGTEALSAGLICIPAAAHAGAVSRAVSIGAPFFLEKPAVLGESDLTEAEWSTSVPSLVACNMRFQPEISAVLWWGKQQPQTQSEWLIQTNMSQWPGASYASDLVECGSHEIDLAIQLLQRPVIVMDALHKFDRWIIELGDHAGNRAKVTIDGHHKGSSCRFGAVQSSTGARMTYQWTRTPDDLNRCYLEQMRHFLRVVKGEEVSVNPLSKARDVVRICDEVAKVARTA